MFSTHSAQLTSIFPTPFRVYELSLSSTSNKESPMLISSDVSPPIVTENGEDATVISCTSCTVPTLATALPPMVHVARLTSLHSNK